MPDQVYSVSWNGVEKVTNNFDSLSRLSKRTVNGLATNYTYKDLEGNQTTTLVKSIETVGITHTYEYDSLGNITSIYDGSKTTTYKYDALNQLVRADNPYENKTHIYTYENGNITEDKVYQYTVGTSEPSDLKYTVKYSYNNKNWADVLTGVERIFPQNSVNAISIEQEETPEIVTRLLGENAQRYDMKSRLSLSNNISALSNSKNEYYDVTSDEIGNITSYDGLNYTWVGRQLKSVSSAENSSVGATYSYNSDGQRIGKNITLDDGETYDYDYYYNGDTLAGYKLVITKSDGSSTTHNVAFMYDENGEAFGFNYNGNDYYYVRNAQNDVIFISNSDNTGVVMYQYDAWGNMTACYDTSDDGMLSIINPYAYRGYFYEIETNTYFLKSRYYNPELCRFISADSVDVLDEDQDNVLENNLFAYCLNNPINMVDDDGELASRIIGGIVGGATGVILGIILANRLGLTGWKKAALIAAAGIGGAALGAFLGPYVAKFAKSIGKAAKKAVSTLAKGELCFVAGTQILTENGYIPIEDIEVGDYVYAENPETGEKGLKRVKETYINEISELVHLTINGEEIITTPGHPFYVINKGWVGSEALKIGDELITYENGHAIVESIKNEILDEPVTVFNFEVDDFHTYYVGMNSILVHNKGCGLNKLANSYLKKTLKLDAHAIKREYLGRKAKISLYDLAVDKKTGIIYIVDKAGRIVAETIYKSK